MDSRVIQGDCRDVMRQLIAEGVRVQCVVTSPPYWGLRDYGVPPSIWGGDPTCAHEWGDQVTAHAASYGVNSKARWNHRENGRGEVQEQMFDRAGWERKDVKQGSFCRCGAWLGALGLEPDYRMFIAHMVEIFGLVRELLADDGTCWMNLGDSYATGAGAVGNCPGGGVQGERWRGGHEGKHGQVGPSTQPNRMPQSGLKPKDLCMMPARVAIALQDAGWWLRQDIIWSKPNPMPESVRDRCTKAHEYVFLMTKAERYFYDADAIKEAADPSNGRDTPSSRRDVPPGSAPDSGFIKGRRFETRNKRSVWTIPTQPYPEAHFATFPEALVEPCILAGSRPGDIIFDPFMGSGTVASVAQRLGRRWLGSELNPAYIELIERRTRGTLGLELSA